MHFIAWQAQDLVLMNLSNMCVLLLGNPGIEIHQTHSLISIHYAIVSAGVIHVAQRGLY